MCTAITYKTKDFYFGRTLDNEFTYGESITITPRNYSFNINGMTSHYGIIGMAYVLDGYPLYYDAINEKGLAMAGLNFVGNACYNKEVEGINNIASFQLIPYILGSCKDVKSAKSLIESINITDKAFNENMPPAQLHWIIADENSAITVEAVKEGLKIYENTVGVMTNNPPFNEQIFNLNNYMNLSPVTPINNFSDKLDLKPYSKGMGAIGLPGDLSSMSRFVRAAFYKLNSTSGYSEEESVNQFFHIINGVDQPRGCNRDREGNSEITQYSSCCNCNKGIYYYTTYGNHQISAVNIHNEDLDGRELVSYPLNNIENINFQN